jgi:chromosome partitioning protein
MKVIVIANIAGGVGKTTAAHAIAVASVEYGKKVLLIDADPAAALTFCCGIENPRVTTLEFLTGQFSLDSAIVKSSERFSLIPSSSRLAAIESETIIEKVKFLKMCEEFDVVIVDTATGPNQVLTYFLDLADVVISPTTTEILAVRGSLHILDFCQATGNSTKIHVLLNDIHQNIENELLNQVKDDFAIIEPVIRRDSLVADSQVTGKSVLSVYKDSGVASDFREATYSILEGLSLI